MTTKIRISTGVVDIEYEGPEDFAEKNLLVLLQEATKISASNSSPAGAVGSADPLPQNTPSTEKAASLAGSLGTTNSIAAKLNVQNGSDLIMAAAAQLSINQNKGEFTRKELADEMKAATNYYKETYLSNLSAYLKNLVKAGRLFERSANTYALPAPVRGELEVRLAAT